MYMYINIPIHVLINYIFQIFYTYIQSRISSFLIVLYLISIYWDFDLILTLPPLYVHDINFPIFYGIEKLFQKIQLDAKVRAL